MLKKEILYFWGSNKIVLLLMENTEHRIAMWQSINMIILSDYSLYIA